MTQMTDNEQALLASLELSASRLNILRAMLDLFEESDPFAYESAYFNAEVRQEYRHRAVRMLSGLSDLAAYYYLDANRTIESHYADIKNCTEQAQ